MGTVLRWLEEAEELVRNAGGSSSPEGLSVVARALFRERNPDADKRHAISEDHHAHSETADQGIDRAEAVLQEHARSRCAFPPAVASSIVRAKTAQLVRAGERQLSHCLLERLRRISHSKTGQYHSGRSSADAIECSSARACTHQERDFPQTPSPSLRGKRHLAKGVSGEITINDVDHNVHGARGRRLSAAQKLVLSRVLMGWIDYVGEKKRALRTEELVLGQARAVLATADQQEARRFAEVQHSEALMHAAELEAADAFRAQSLAKICGKSDNFAFFIYLFF